jgi:hypothetical protein
MAYTSAPTGNSPRNTFIGNLSSGLSNIGSDLAGGIKTTANEFVNNTKAGIGYGIAGLQGVAKTPIKIGASLADLPSIVQGKNPAQPFNVPGLGSVSTYARDAVDGSAKDGYVASALKAGSQGILDTALLGGVTQAAVKGLRPAAEAAQAPVAKGGVPDPAAPGASDPFNGTQTLYRGENASNAGGTHFTTDQNWAKNFGDKMYQGTLPKDAKLYNLTPQDMQSGYEKGFTNENQLYDDLFKNGNYDALVGHDAMRSSVPDIIVNPRNRSLFTEGGQPATQAVQPLVEPHLKSAQMILDRMSPDEFGNAGGLPALLDRTKINIADGLDAYKMGDAASKIRALKVAPGTTFDAFKALTSQALGY